MLLVWGVLLSGEIYDVIEKKGLAMSKENPHMEFVVFLINMIKNQFTLLVVKIYVNGVIDTAY